MVNLNERIATLEDRLRQLKAQQHRIDTPRRTVKSRKDRKEDTAARSSWAPSSLRKLSMASLRNPGCASGCRSP